MKYNAILQDEPESHFEIRNDAGMNIGIAFPNASPFDGCAPVTLKDAENNARLWAAADELLEALESIIGMAEDGYTLHKRNGSHREFLSEDVDALNAAKAAIAKAKAL